ncbi:MULTISPECIES: AMIN domain-containing protein [Leptolyngbya]|uniref:AMIN domain-containing protein n=1 Tax=Leptolyngbya TaxID=47251 RepID=UPI00168308B4|nr:AMIN domain-containing protein [Leptolyngbya sp. FACHB-1624]MBD1857096.1 AMIN domain-containing protein [Leptolyngbya sp. FACHB-1624]
MLKKALTFSELISAIVLLTSASAIAAPLENLRFDPDINQLEVTLAAGIKPTYSLLSKPDRIVLDLPNTQVGQISPQQTFMGAVRQVRVFQFQPDTTRIVLELAPNQTLATQQVQLQQAPSSDKIWILRPTLAARTPSPQTQAVFNSLRPIQTAPLPKTTPIQPAEPKVAQTSATPANDFGLPPAPPTINPDLPPVTPPPATNSAPPAATVPDLPPAQSTPLPPAAGSGNAPTGSSLLFPDAPITPRAVPQSPGLQLPEVNPSLAIPDSFPPINAPTNLPSTPPTVTVPQLDRRSPDPSSIVEPRSTSAPVEDTPVPVRQRTIQFGQPLPTLINQQPPSTPQQISRFANGSSESLLPVGTKLSLFYPGNEPLKLQGNQSRQDVLILQNEIRDRAGRLLVAPGSAVMGKFETDRNGSRFVTQAVTIQGQNLAFIGKSDTISGNPQVQDHRLIQNSGLGAIAGAVLGGFSGGNVIGGAALGAGVTYLTASRPATIQPRQLIQIQLTQDFNLFSR